MNIAIFTNNYLPNPYGVTVSIETFRIELERRGHTVYIFAPRWKGYTDKNPNVFRYPSVDMEFKLRFPLPVPYSWRISKIIKNLEIDIIHAQHPNLLGSVARRWAKKLSRSRSGKKVPLIFTWHTLYDKYTNFVPFVPAKIAGDYIIKKAVKFANSADRVIAPTDSIIPILEKWGVKKEKIIAIPTGIKKEAFENANPKIVREKHNLSKEIIIFTFSRLTEEKNVEFIFRALKNILADSPLEKKESGLSAGRVKFLVAGDGYLLPRLKKYCVQEKISSAVIFCGFIPKKDLKNYLAASDIFVYASKSETQGMAPLEAMSAGLPIVAVRSTGISSLVLDRASGFLTEEKEKNFSEAILKLIHDPVLRHRFAEASQKIARENFTSEICADKMLQVYEDAISFKAEL